jgi:hypothetical protein
VFLLLSDKANRNKNADTNTNLFDLSTTTEDLCDWTGQLLLLAEREER